MFKKTGILLGLMALAGPSLMADFSYQETTTITGGALIGMMKVMGVFSKQARQLREPIHSTVAIKGDRMVHRGPNEISVIDLGKQTITSIDLQRKTYSVMTFDEMKQAMDQMAQQMKQSGNGNAQMDFKVSAKDTGNKKQVAGLDATELVLRMEMQGTDQQSGQTGGMVITNDMWVAPAVPGYGEVREFHRRLAERLNWTPGGNMFAARPDVAKGMAEAAKEMAKMDGMPVLQNMVMGADASGQAGQQSTAQQQPQQQQQQQSQQQAADKPSVGGALGGALSGRFGFGRKKSQPKTDDQTAQSQPAQGQAQGSTPGSLLEMTTELSGFSSDAADASQFEIPAGFKQVEAPMKRMAK